MLMLAMRRLISFLVALGLIAAGIFWAIHIWLYAEKIYVKVLLAPTFMVVIGCIWLYYDYIDATPNEKP